jgi:putative ABC transport system ATP-binding protein
VKPIDTGRTGEPADRTDTDPTAGVGRRADAGPTAGVDGHRADAGPLAGVDGHRTGHPADVAETGGDVGAGRSGAVAGADPLARFDPGPRYRAELGGYRDEAIADFGGDAPPAFGDDTPRTGDTPGTGATSGTGRRAAGAAGAGTGARAGGTGDSGGPFVAVEGEAAGTDGSADSRAGQVVGVEDITISYGGHPVLADVSVRAMPGQLLAVTGPSGAGKTTLLWTIAGLVAPETGAVRLDDQQVRDRDQTLAAGVALIPQDNGLAAILTAQENVLVPLLATGVPADEAVARTERMLAAVGLGGQADQLVEELSGGQQQRVAIARGLAANARVLLADEVTSELDAQNRQRVVELLREQAWQGATVVFATHDPDAAAACDAELHLRDGRGELIRGGD